MGLISPLTLSATQKSDAGFPHKYQKFIKEARYYEKLQHKQIRCNLCPRECVIDDRERGYCGVRENREGTYYTLVYGRPCTYHTDPIEKKPLFHFHPGSMAFSIATGGCNLNCKFCQNWQISQVSPEQIRHFDLPPPKTADTANQFNALSIAYTYSEPVIFYEYMYDTVIAGHERGLKSVMITAGYIKEKPLIDLCAHIDAIKVDLKAFSQKYYRDVVNGDLQPVLDALITMHKQNVWTEIVYLVVPTMNDGEKEIRALSRWIKEYLGDNVPVHFTRFHPQYLMKNLPPTPVSTLERCKSIADSEGLNFVFIGNVPGHPAEHTYCPSCGTLLIERIGFTIRSNHLNQNQCSQCGQEIAGIWF
ncbi:MAG: AmmeMemoRadiSam system radical SAM enzyme [Caldithrix sp.]|nr:AmmeMemoRadiSam system radical SAM enzyme [Caldithrix sp.]